MTTKPTDDFDLNLKFILLGDSGVGKSSLLQQYCEHKFDDLLSTIGIDFRIKKVEREDKKIKLAIWDTAGQERFKSISLAYCRGSQGVVFVYDVSSRFSFQKVTDWLERLKRTVPDHGSMVTVLVANKCDLVDQRVIDTREGQRLADSLGMRYFETSAATALNIDAPFDHLIARCIDSPNDPHGGLSLTDDEPTSCCTLS
ncbi:MAG: Rab family GTPase [archaeon]|nr:Rab family GTPase [archaeon]